MSEEEKNKVEETLKDASPAGADSTEAKAPADEKEPEEEVDLLDGEKKASRIEKVMRTREANAKAAQAAASIEGNATQVFMDRLNEKEEAEKEERLDKVKRVRAKNAAQAEERARKEAKKKKPTPKEKAERAAKDENAASWEKNEDFYVELPSKMKKKSKHKKDSPFIPGTTDADWECPLGPGEEYAIKCRNVKIRYKSVQSYSIKKSLLRLKKVDTKSFEAVRGVSFEVKKGEIFGITGKNGSGKSTLLRALGHVFSADEGTIDLYDHSVSLLAIGVGFMPDLTGRENIMLSGMLLGFTEKEVQSHMQEIIDFAGLGEFIDMPVRTYSSGMHSKLAFSITAFLDTDIMLIDEVFSVGDAKFKKKSYAKMQELISEKNRTVVIVSHNLFTLETLCDRVMWLHDGRIVKIGDPLEIIEEYREFMS